MNDTNDCKPSANTPSTNKPPFIQRKSPRAAFHDYNNGDYFVTICTKGHKHYFGKNREWRDEAFANGNICDQRFGELAFTLQICPSTTVRSHAKPHTCHCLH